MAQRKMFAADIDGTLTNSKKEITPKTRESILQMINEGHVFVIASGRPTPGVKKVCEQLQAENFGGYMLSYNGSVITDIKSGKIVYERKIDKSYAAQMFDFAKERDMGLMTYEEDTAITGTRIDEYMLLEARINGIKLKEVENFAQYVNFDVNKFLFTAEAEKAAAAERELCEKYKELSVYRSEPFFTEVMPGGVNKASALAELLKLLNMKREDLICCGDGFNDLSMIKYAGVGVAMANAVPEGKAAADFVTGSNEEDGIVTAIERFVLNI
ncbi:MAG: Cof-type HAD-IIB family hydrolase [Clostridia bacterium]|nr:Cof-type HAD-IIB family hydrolase [Clostridia bacterium]